MSDSTTTSAELRIITAGRTGLENDLRRDESIELIRARTSLDAIGELANPIDELSPSGTVLLVGPDAITEGEVDEFIEAVRKITPDAKIVLVSNKPMGADRFDAVLPLGKGADELWSALGMPDRNETEEPVGLVEETPQAEIEPAHEAKPAHEAEPAHDPTPAPANEPVQIHTRPVRPASAPVAPPITAHTPSRLTFDPADVLDEALLAVIGAGDDAETDDPIDAALTGGDTLKAGLAELRRDLGTEAIEYVPGEDAKGGEAVRRGNRIFGALHARGVEHTELTRAASRLADRLALARQLHTLREAAFTDELTGAWNRRFFQRFLERSIERARLSRQDLSLMVFDIDDFKTYNDRYGHPAGDEILVEVVRLLVAVIRPHDRVCRIGGDEFAVIFADGPREASSRHPSSIETIARRFQQQICEHRFPKLGADAMGTLTISGGLATFPWEAHDSASLIELADQLAMQSKRSGKNVITMGPDAEEVCSDLDPDADDAD